MIYIISKYSPGEEHNNDLYLLDIYYVPVYCFTCIRHLVTQQPSEIDSPAHILIRYVKTGLETSLP